MWFQTFPLLLPLFVSNAQEASVEPKAERPPNIVLILADDLGYGELGSYGQIKIKTPHLDRLAEQGMRFTRHYSGAPVCAPARCVLLTGKQLHRAQIRGNKKFPKFEGQWPLEKGTQTLATALQNADYQTRRLRKMGPGQRHQLGQPQ